MNSTPKPIESIILQPMSSKRRLVLSLAHPDDESFGTPPVSTILHYAKQGVAVHLICATRGEAGEVNESFLQGFDSIAALRTSELMCAAKKLGLAGVHFLNYHDSGMENTAANDNPACLVQAPLDEVTEKVTGLLRQIRPQVVITFDPSGGYFHPDHIHIHKATTQAFQAAGDATQFSHQLQGDMTPHQPQKLYYTVFSRGLIRAFMWYMILKGEDPKRGGRNGDIDLKRIAEVKQPITTKLKAWEYYWERLAAAQCHACQFEGTLNRLPHWFNRVLSRFETYTRIYPVWQEGERIEMDLFAETY